MHVVGIVGSSNTDLVWHGPRLPRPGETVLGDHFARYGGGKGANQAVAAARAGAKVIFVGARGDDDFGRAAAAALRAEGIDTSHFYIKPGTPSGVALIFIGGRGRENMIGVAPSANRALTGEDVRGAAPALRRAKAIGTVLEIQWEAIEAAADLAQENGSWFVVTPAPVPPKRLPRALLRKVAVLVPNEGEALALARTRTVDRAASALTRSGCRYVVVTMGARGARIFGPDGSRHVPAPKVRPVDTVGAGDCFSGWLMASLAEGLPIEVAVERAVRAASISVTRPGAQASMPRREEVVTA